MSKILTEPAEHILIIKLENNLIKNPYYLNFNEYTATIQNLSANPSHLKIQKGGKNKQLSDKDQALLQKEKYRKEKELIATLRKKEKMKQKMKQRNKSNIKNYMKIKPLSKKNYTLGTISETAYITEIISNLLKAMFKDKTYTMCVRRPHSLKFINDYTSPQVPKYRIPILYYSGKLKCEKTNIFDNKNKMYEIMYDSISYNINSYTWNGDVNAILYKDILAEKNGKYSEYYKILKHMYISEHTIIYVPTVHLYLIKKGATYIDKIKSNCNYHKMEIKKTMHKNKLRRRLHKKTLKKKKNFKES